MPTKKTTTKKKVLKKVIIKPNAIIPPFDLTMEDTDENARIFMALTSLKYSAGWQFLLQVFTENKRLLEQMILDKVDSDGKPVSDTVLDELRYKRAYLVELMGKPDSYLSKLEPKTSPVDRLDPYYQGDETEG